MRGPSQGGAAARKNGADASETLRGPLGLSFPLVPRSPVLSPSLTPLNWHQNWRKLPPLLSLIARMAGEGELEGGCTPVTPMTSLDY